jgi:hypothetical protein
MPAKDLNELITWLKANPNRASVGTGSAGARVVTAFFQKETGTQLTIVPYRGFTPAMQDLVAGQIDLLFEASNGLSLVQVGSIKAYAVTLGNLRANGVRSLDVTCSLCHHRAILSADPWPDDVPVPSVGPRMVCTWCGIIGADAWPN